MNYGPRRPIFWDNPDVVKAQSDSDKWANPSFESFRQNVVHPVEYNEQPADRPALGNQMRIRRFPDGKLDVSWLMNQMLDALKKLEYNGDVLPIEAALLTVVLPMKFQLMDPHLAEIRTQLSSSEKESLKTLLTAKLREIDNWNAGTGGGSVEGRTRTWNGGN